VNLGNPCLSPSQAPDRLSPLSIAFRYPSWHTCRKNHDSWRPPWGQGIWNRSGRISHYLRRRRSLSSATPAESSLPPRLGNRGLDVTALALADCPNPLCSRRRRSYLIIDSAIYLASLAPLPLRITPTSLWQALLPSRTNFVVVAGYSSTTAGIVVVLDRFTLYRRWLV
jgi:hypothetical protein